MLLSVNYLNCLRFRESLLNSNYIKFSGTSFFETFIPYLNNQQAFVDIIFEQESATGARANLRIYKATKKIEFYYKDNKTSSSWTSYWSGTLS